MRTGAQNFVIPHTLLGRTPVGVCDEGRRAARWPGQAHTGGQATLALVTNHPAARKERAGCVDWALSLFLYGAQCGVNSASAHAASLRAARTPTASGLAGAAFAALVTQRNRGLCEGAQSHARAVGRGPFCWDKCERRRLRWLALAGGGESGAMPWTARSRSRKHRESGGARWKWEIG